MTKNLVFIDSRVAGYQTLISTFDADTQSVLIDAEQDGVLQMQAALARYSGLDSIQVISHGSAGTLYLGSTTLTSANLASYATVLTAIGASLTETGDLLLYGCNVGQGDVGLAFINALSGSTGADVAASSDATGAAAVGGDWVLEAQTGTKETATLAWTADAGLLALNTAPAFRAPGSGGKAIIPVGTGGDNGYSVALQSDGKIVMAGTSYDNSGFPDYSLIRLNTDGRLDASFDGDGKALIPVGPRYDDNYCVVLQSDGKIILAGESFNNSGNWDFSLIRLNASGSLDTSFDGDGKAILPVGIGDDRGQSAVFQSDGKIVVAGYSTVGTGYDFSLIRLNSDGSLDTSFDGDGTAIIPVGTGWDQGNSVVLQSDGKIVLAGSSVDGNWDFSLIRLNTDGSLDTSFDGDGKVIVPGTYDDFGRSVVLQSDGKIVLAGSSNGVTGTTDFSLIRLNPDGSLDTSFDGDGKVIVPVGTYDDFGHSVVLQSDGKMVVAGYSTVGNGYDFSLIRLNTDGSLDASFDGDGKVIIQLGTGLDQGKSVALQSDGKIVLAGTSIGGGGSTNFSLIRLNVDGSLDTSFSRSSLLDASPQYTGDSAVVLDTDVQIDDPELQAANSFSGATLTLSRHGGANASDVFSASGTLSALTAGSYFTSGGATIGLVVSNGNGVLQLGFNSNATQALVSGAMQQIAYANTAAVPSAFAQIDWIFSDGNTGAQGGDVAMSVTGSTVVNITARNAAPVVASALADITIEPNQFFSYVIPANAFTDANEGELLSYGVGINDGTLLPVWLKFDSATKTFTGNPGTPGVFDLKSFDIKVTATDHVGSSVSDVFRLRIALPNSPPTGGVTITGIAKQGETLTVNNTLADLDGLGAVSYQWLADGSAISGATGRSLVLTQPQVGKVIKVAASYTDDFGTPESKFSSETSVVSEDEQPPTVITINATLGTVVATFNETIALGTGNIVLKTAAGTTIATFDAGASTNLTISGNSLTIYPIPDLSHRTQYVLEVPAGAIKDLGGKPYAVSTSYAFTAFAFTNSAGSTFIGTNGAESLLGTTGDDTIIPSLGNDSIDAGAGVDTVVLPMFPNVFNLSQSSPSHISGFYGTNTAIYTVALENVERAQFGSTFQTTIAMSKLVSGEAQMQLGRLTDLYLAFFGRAPDVGGLEYWQEKLLELGRDFATISKDFAWSTEAQALFPVGGSNRDFVRTVYLNCFAREPDPGGWDFWTQKLDGLGVTDLNDRGAFVGEVILGAYAPSSGDEDRSLLTNRHDAAMYYVNQLSNMPTEGFDRAINTLLTRVTGDSSTQDKAEHVIDHAFANPITLTGVMTDQALLDSIWEA